MQVSPYGGEVGKIHAAVYSERIVSPRQQGKAVKRQTAVLDHKRAVVQTNLGAGLHDEDRGIVERHIAIQHRLHESASQPHLAVQLAVEGQEVGRQEGVCHAQGQVRQLHAVGYGILVRLIFPAHRQGLIAVDPEPEVHDLLCLAKGDVTRFYGEVGHRAFLVDEIIHRRITRQRERAPQRRVGDICRHDARDVGQHGQERADVGQVYARQRGGQLVVPLLCRGVAQTEPHAFVVEERHVGIDVFVTAKQDIVAVIQVERAEKEHRVGREERHLDAIPHKLALATEVDAPLALPVVHIDEQVGRAVGDFALEGDTRHIVGHGLAVRHVETVADARRVLHKPHIGTVQTDGVHAYGAQCQVARHAAHRVGGDTDARLPHVDTHHFEVIGEWIVVVRPQLQTEVGQVGLELVIVEGVFLELFPQLVRERLEHPRQLRRPVVAPEGECHVAGTHLRTRSTRVGVGRETDVLGTGSIAAEIKHDIADAPLDVEHLVHVGSKVDRHTHRPGACAVSAEEVGQPYLVNVQRQR